MKQGNLEDFISYLLGEVENHSIYVFGAQGQGDPTIKEYWIRQREAKTGGERVGGKYMTYADIAVQKWQEECENGYKERLHAFDCSGLVCFYLLGGTGIDSLISCDHTANGLMKSYTDCTEHEPKKGMWLFRTDANGKATHIGIMVSDTECVHAKGRLYGVIQEKYSKSYWHHCYAPKLFDLEEDPEPILTKYVHPKGNVRVRKGNGTSYKQIKPTATKKDYLPYLGQAEDSPYWYKVTWQNSEGYITSKDRYTEVVEK